MSLPAWQQRALERIEGALQASEPHLASMFAIFARLNANEPVGEEPLARPRQPKRRRSAGTATYAVLLIPVMFIMVVVGAVVGGSARSATTCDVGYSVAGNSPLIVRPSCLATGKTTAGKTTTARRAAPCAPAALAARPAVWAGSELGSFPPAGPKAGAGGTPETCYKLPRDGGPLPIEHLGHEAAELLSLTTGGEARSLNKLAELAAWQVPACCGAHAAVWRDGEVISAAATHPDLAELADRQLTAGRGPIVTAVDTGITVSCQDTLDERRWPEYATAALRCGVRCSVHLVRELPRGALVLSLFGARPGVLDEESDPMADMLAAFGGAMLTNATAYNQAQRTANQLKDAVVARSVVDQAKGILMHALGCDAADALQRLRRESQRRHVKVTVVASEVVAAYGGEGPSGPPGPMSGGPKGARPA